MSYVRPILIVLLIAGGCRTSPETRRSIPPPPSPAQCPNKHLSLKEVPVIYGLLDWTPELRRQVDNREVIAGGCVPGPNESYVVCFECDFRFDAYARRWERCSEDRLSFQRPFGKLIDTFPEFPNATPQYRQFLDEDGQFVGASLVLWTSEGFDVVVETVEQFLTTDADSVEKKTNESFGGKRVNLTGHFTNSTFEVEVFRPDNDNQTLVHLRIHRSP